MSWTLWIVASAVFLAFYDLLKKASVRENAVMPVLTIATAAGSLAYVASLATFGDLAAAMRPDRTVLAFAAVKTLIVGTSWILTYCALRTLPVTIATPIRASAPAFVIMLAVLIYAERPSSGQWLGMALVLVGFLAFSWAGKAEGIDFLRSKAVYFALGGMAMSVVSSLWDKYVFQVSALPVEPVQFYFQSGLFIFYTSILLLRKVSGVKGDPFEWRWSIPFVGIILAAADWFYFHGLAFPDVPISVGSLLRRFSVVITFVLGAILFHERNLRRKGIALSLILAGTCVICLSA